MKSGQGRMRQGLQENAFQFWILVLVNAFVGGMVGLERSIFPEIAQEEFGITSHTAVLSFIIAFGITKAITNYFTGIFANLIGRKNLLIIGWIVALPIPIILMFAQSWNLIVFANILLGINQGLTWSSTVVMKIDLVGEKKRGMAMGLNEFSGYLAVGIVTFFTAYIADRYGLRPYPFYLGIVLSVLGLLFSVFIVKDTRHFVQLEKKDSHQSNVQNVFYNTTFQNRNLSSTTQAGLINNLNDGMIWGLLPFLLLEQSFSQDHIGTITAIYPIVWGVGQILTGPWSDHYSKKKILFTGMLLQSIAITSLVFVKAPISFMILSVIIGFGTAMVYPTFLVVISANTSPEQRPESIGVFRLWRDLGYAIGALISGIIADFMGIPSAIIFIGILTMFSAFIIKVRMIEQEVVG